MFKPIDHESNSINCLRRNSRAGIGASLLLLALLPGHRQSHNLVIDPQASETLTLKSHRYFSIFEQTLGQLQVLLGLSIHRTLDFQVVSRSELESLHQDSFGTKGNQSLSGLFLCRDNDSDIFILGDTNEDSAAWTITHELAHAWQAEHCPNQQEVSLREGICEWIAWKIISKSNPSSTALNAALNRTDNYGTWFKQCRELEQSLGTEAFLKKAATCLNFSAFKPEQ